jgi:aspartate/methionine/tyrosine aminotransferase
VLPLAVHVPAAVPVWPCKNSVEAAAEVRARKSAVWNVKPSERALRVRDVFDAVGSIPSETIATLAFQRLDSLLERAQRILGAGQALAREFVYSRDELDWIEPAGGGVAFPRLVDSTDAGPFVQMALDEFGLGITPGEFFGAPEHFRLGVGGKRHVLESGLETLGRALDRASS